MAFQKRGNGKEPYHHKPNRGSMFENDRKMKETQPDFTGSIDVNGVTYWLSGWKQISEGGKKYLSVAVTLQEERPQQPPQGRQQTPPRKPTSW